MNHENPENAQMDDPDVVSKKLFFIMLASAALFGGAAFTFVILASL